MMATTPAGATPAAVRASTVCFVGHATPGGNAVMGGKARTGAPW